MVNSRCLGRCSVIIAAALLVAVAATPVSAATTERSVYYNYDVAGRQLSATFDSATGSDGVTNVYNGFGELTSSTLTMGTFSKALTSAYDCAGRRKQLTHPDGDAFAYTYDSLGRLSAVYQGTASTACPAVSTGSQLENYTYTTAGVPSGRSEGAGAGVSSSSYGWDAVNRLTSQTDVFSVKTLNVSWTFTFNPASEIATEARSVPNDGSSDPYAYVPAAANLNYAVNGLNQYKTAGTASFTYDGNGNLITTPDPNNPGGTVTYTYDVENRLLTAATSTTTTTMTYDPLGRLFEVVKKTGSTTNSDTRFLYDGDALALEYDANGNVLNRYVHGTNAAADDPLVWYSGASLGTVRYLHADHLGSIVGIASSTGTTYATYGYDEYGINQSAAGPADRFGYTGQAYIPELGLYYYKARFYSPSIGRFLQTDPIGYAGGVNIYEYVGDDPVDLSDPTGNAGQCDTGSRIANNSDGCMVVEGYQIDKSINSMGRPLQLAQVEPSEEETNAEREPGSNARLAPGGIRAQRTFGGHPEEHVGRSARELQERLQREPRLSAASSFRTEGRANYALAHAVRANQTEINEWIDSGAAFPLEIKYRSPSSLGTVVYRGSGPQAGYTGVFVLRPIDHGGIIDFNYDYYVVTGYVER